MADTPLPPATDTDIHAGLDVKKKTTRVNLAVVAAVLLFFAIGVAVVVKVAFNPPQRPSEGTPASEN